jgi:hypothetical protein
LTNCSMALMTLGLWVSPIISSFVFIMEPVAQ